MQQFDLALTDPVSPPEEAEAISYAPLSSLVEMPKTAGRFCVDLDGLAYRFRLFPSRDTAHLTVLLNAVAYQDKKTDRATWTRYKRAYGSNLIQINDPTLGLARGVRVSCFLGSEQRDPIEGVVRIAAAAADALGVSRDRIVYVGNSGSGFGAIMAAARTGAAAIATNPQLELSKAARTPTSARLITTFAKGKSLEDLCAAYPARSSVLAALAQARAAGRRPQIVVAQNVQDAFHLDTHFTALARGLAEPSNAPLREAVRTLVFDAPSGHRTPHLTLLRQLADTVLDAVWNAQTFAALPAVNRL